MRIAWSSATHASRVGNARCARQWPSFAEVFVDEGRAAYIGGTLVNIKNETMGKLDTTQEKALSFNYEGGKVTIPYDKVESWKYDEVLARQLGVIATTVVVLLKHRQ